MKPLVLLLCVQGLFIVLNQKHVTSELAEARSELRAIRISQRSLRDALARVLEVEEQRMRYDQQYLESILAMEVEEAHHRALVRELRLRGLGDID